MNNGNLVESDAFERTRARKQSLPGPRDTGGDISKRSSSGQRDGKPSTVSTKGPGLKKKKNYRRSWPYAEVQKGGTKRADP